MSLIALIVAIVAIVWSYHEKDQIADLTKRIATLEKAIISGAEEEQVK